MISGYIQENTSSDKGVSPIISVILMLAVTIILSAVVGSFVLNLAGDALNDPVQGAVDFEHEYDEFYGVYIVDGVLVSAPNLDYIELRGDIDGPGCSGATGEYLFDNRVEEVGNNAVVCVSGETGGEVRAVGYLNENAQVLQSYQLQDRDN